MAGESSVLRGEISALSLTNGVLCRDLKDVTQGSSSPLALVGRLSAHPAGVSCQPVQPQCPHSGSWLLGSACMQTSLLAGYVSQHWENILHDAVISKFSQSVFPRVGFRFL